MPLHDKTILVWCANSPTEVVGPYFPLKYCKLSKLRRFEKENICRDIIKTFQMRS